MRTLFQLGLREQRPLWLQILALFCILTVCAMSTAQVSHTHAEFSALKQQGPHQGPFPDDHCPLCVAIHSALSAPQHFAPEPTLAVHHLDSVAEEARSTFRWRFEMACRPPPVGNSV
ncbi:MAG TPA: hypothetical protein VL495_10475 [Edaphobacter sp.]|jgi:hypothetical protein|nr:hypothetical protein [Edaphobacter sp.]